MTSTISSNKPAGEIRAVFGWSLKKRLGLMGLFTGLNFMAMPLILFLALNNAKTNRDLLPANGYTIDLNNVFAACVRLVFPLLVLPLSLLLVIILSVLLYGYMHQKRSVDLFHSLPVRRGPLLGGRFLAGVVMLAVPLAISFLVSVLLCLYFGLEAAQYLPYLGKAFAWILFISVVCFLFSTLMAVCSGTTFDMVISIVVISVTYPLLIVLARMVAGMLLPGLMVKNLLGSVVTTALSPFAAAFIYFVPGEAGIEFGSFGPAFVVWWVFLAAVMAVAAVVLYRKRKSECAESNFAFPLPKIFIRFIATGAAGFACALVFFSTLNSDASFWVGLLAGSFAAHIIAEAVYGRGFKGLKRSFGYYGVFLAAFAVYYGILATGAFGFDTRIPTASRVTSVEINISDIVFSSSGYNGNFQNTEFTVWSKDHKEKIARVQRELKNPASVQKAVSYHKELVSAIRGAGYPYRVSPFSSSGVTFTYHLQDGTSVDRSYPYRTVRELADDKTQEKLNGLMESLQTDKEFRSTGDPIFYLTPDFVKSVTLIPESGGEGTTIVPDRAKIQELIEALREDTLNAKPSTDPGEQKGGGVSIQLDLKPAVPAEGTPLREEIGNYSGEVSLNNIYYYQLNADRFFPRAKKFIEDNGWIKFNS